ncbi:flavodoxin-dependent (E)-4-hydroxy-3-methylbut-2-enyl-diphosphate synthase [Gracilinema caldarium]|uniref:4-hydroxy-3-methylbut-2-en-1-yl diphosphate synthase (flavodoxin) n=1 Tax=Gracilinema caldarium (strain ATCC 51460 / DSM 7334 / H1) TaxID=744872 RepID=F8EXR1_GRAC1|nr:flavodoxin-dependent (E)-4-hydroxy-3-methylbut-2-enyl-diphosphate synthase [Gracilinema caldarium]AEJ19642.1 4-hydroxy-3-methylbut-2-en-1-yl diphosphate synthase [Gracilinema caldarium DSM 7334]
MKQNQMVRVVKIGGFDHLSSVLVGGAYPVAVQTMWKDRLDETSLQGESGKHIETRIDKLQKLGCSLLRFAVPDLAAADVLGELAKRVTMPLVADIHFDYKIALRCLDFPIAKIRINPGNIGSLDKVKAVAAKAAEKGVPIRIGINAGSLPADLRKAVDEQQMTRAEALVSTAERELEIFETLNFKNVLLSMKASSIYDTLEANRLIAKRTDVPLHLGVTEAGPLIPGIVRNSIALHTLLAEGIGATIRVSLSDTMENEVIAGREIVSAVADSSGKGVNGQGVIIVSCPRCGRNSFDTHAFTERWRDTLYMMKKDITVAIMGCAVNGPGEARHADIGITGAGNKVLIFRHGNIVRTVAVTEADQAFKEELEKL